MGILPYIYTFVKLKNVPIKIIEKYTPKNFVIKKKSIYYIN